MECKTNTQGDRPSLCPNIEATIRTIASLASDGSFIYDCKHAEFSQVHYFSDLIEQAMQGRSLQSVLNEHHISLARILETTIQQSQEGRLDDRILAVNLCLDEKSRFYIHLQLKPISLGTDSSRSSLYAGVIRLAPRQEVYVHLIDLEESSYQPYHLGGNHFMPSLPLPQLTELEQETLRLARSGYSEERIALTLNRSAHTIKNYKRTIFIKTQCHILREAIAYAELYHLI